jgi:hypothetical protein
MGILKGGGRRFGPCASKVSPESRGEWLPAVRGAQPGRSVRPGLIAASGQPSLPHGIDGIFMPFSGNFRRLCRNFQKGEVRIMDADGSSGTTAKGRWILTVPPSF